MGKKFLIYMNTFDHSSGGQVAMHKLCHDIRTLGREAYTTSRYTHNKLDAPFLGNVELNIEDCVVIYPEIVHGNPLNGKHVVRWILNTPGNCGGVGNGFYDKLGNDDMIYKYSPFFDYDGEIDGYLRCSFIDYELFRNRGYSRDIDECYFIKKNGMKTQHHSSSAINLANFQCDWGAAAELFNRCKKFYCYDNECFWVTLAALCGCVVIVIPNTNLTSLEWKTDFPYNKYGIAFGLDEIKWAEDTLDLVLDNCANCQENDLISVKMMIDKCDKL